ncbi:endopeptidase La [soil metagenome]
MPPRKKTAETHESPAVDETPGSGSEPVAKPRRTRRKTERPPRRRTVSLPVLVVDETVLLPHMSIPFPVEDEESALVLDRSMRTPLRQVLVLTERMVPSADSTKLGGPEFQALLSDIHLLGEEEIVHDKEDQVELQESGGWVPDDDAQKDSYELCPVGVIAEVGQRITRPGGGSHVILQGLNRGVVLEIVQDMPYMVAKVGRHDDTHADREAAEASMTAILEQVENYISMLPNVPEEVLMMVRSVDEPGWLADLIAFSPEFTPEQRQELLEILDPIERLKRLSVMIQMRLDVLNLRQQIASEAQAGMDRQQREYYLREQIRAIQKELGEGSAEETLAGEIRQKIEDAGMPEDIKAKALVQADRLEQQHPFSPEIGMIRSYLEWLTDLPWSVETEDRLDLNEAMEILDADHFGLDKVKDRIIEYIAVRKLAGDRQKAPIICFVGPPGVGKTSLGRSIARAIGRNYVRMSLGGVRDEAEIRGHRRTYVGAMPGRVIKALKDAQSKNPVIVLDEVDKVGSDAFRGDPAAALLEVLDPEQNATFSDHYLEVPFDLSKVIFITTANQLEPIPPALRDRMEVIEVPGYTEVEKLEIATRFLLPKTLESHGLDNGQLQLSDDALRKVIREYTSESGVRNLEREIGSLCRKAARQFAGEDPPSSIVIDVDQIEVFLGVPRFEFGLAEEQDETGVATGAAVTSVGGDLLTIEVTVMDGKGDLILTGQLGDVMQESARAAISYARSHASDFEIESGYFDRHNIHVHIPAGAIPKDGPSAGITIATALISALARRPVRRDVAMTGEITLRGKVLPVGGLREKTLAAHRGGIKTFILPKRNAKDMAELPEVVKSEIQLVQAASIEDVLAVALTPKGKVSRSSTKRQPSAHLAPATV